MKCKKCGEELPKRARFCFACGAPIEDVPEPHRLEEPLDPLAAGAVPLVPIAPPPRAYKFEPKAMRSASARGERRVMQISPETAERAERAERGFVFPFADRIDKASRAEKVVPEDEAVAEEVAAEEIESVPTDAPAASEEIRDDSPVTAEDEPSVAEAGEPEAKTDEAPEPADEEARPATDEAQEDESDEEVSPEEQVAEPEEESEPEQPVDEPEDDEPEEPVVEASEKDEADEEPVVEERTVEVPAVEQTPVEDEAAEDDVSDDVEKDEALEDADVTAALNTERVSAAATDAKDDLDLDAVGAGGSSEPEPAPKPASSPIAFLQGHLHSLKGPELAFAGVMLAVAVIIVVLLAGLATSWIGPFSPAPEEAPKVQPPSDGSIEPIGEDDAEEEGLPEDAPEARATVADYSWEELSQISELIASADTDEDAEELAQNYNLCASDGSLDGTQTKDLELADGTVVSVAIAGFRQDSRADGSGVAGISFIAQEPVTNLAIDPSGETPAWGETSLFSWLNEDLLDELPEELAEAIVPVTKTSNTRGGSQEETTETLWLPSFSELAGEPVSGSSLYGVYTSEGEQYQLFSDQGINSMSYGSLALSDGQYWWTRSVDITGLDGYASVSPDGNPYWTRNTAQPLAVLPGFCL